VEVLTIGEITKAINGTLLKGDEDEPISNISTDSRVISSGDLFIALKGEIFDGHDFLESALDKGASATIISQRRLVNSHPKASIILVPDTLVGLQELARYYRNKFSPTFIAITGSVGKTTTKEMTASILSRRMLVLKNESSYNNEVGVPLTLLRLSSSHQVAILEVGMNHPGEIAHLADIIKPSIGVITNVEEVHLEGVGSLEGVAKAKGELIEA